MFARADAILSTRPLILMASPSSDEQAMYSEYFASIGFRVATATTGDEALAKALALTPTIVVVSEDLPGQDGIEVCHALEDVAVTVILLANSPFYRTASCAAVMLRPALPSQVIATVARLLDPRR